jgi:hypothetical protein
MFGNSAANSATSRMFQYWICRSVVEMVVVMVDVMTVKTSRGVVMVVVTGSNQRTTIINLNQHQLIKSS